jgi:type IV pilus modification protein PilV
MKEEGFSLIELLIAILVLSVTVTGFAGLFTLSYQGVYSAGYQSEAQHVAREAMENMIADITFAHPDATVTRVVTSKAMAMSFSGYGGVSVPGQEIVVTVQYTDGAGRARTQVFRSFVPDN